MEKEVERVLVVPTSTVEHLGIEQGITTRDLRHKLGYLLSKAFFMIRDAAEEDPQHKQIIPYHIVVRSGQILEYARTKKSGEARLRSKRSIGFGGHINLEDNFGQVGMEAYVAGSIRELFVEELNISAPKIENVIVGILNDNTSEVGRVHLGVVHVVRISPMGGVSSKDPAIDLLGFEEASLLRSGAPAPEMEAWSKICLEKENLEELFRMFWDETNRITITNS